MNYRKACLKRDIELTLLFVLVFIGKIIGHLIPLKNNSNIFLFFSSDAIGGATKVNADILSLLIDRQPTVIFSKKYSNNGFAEQFKRPGAHIIDLRDRIDNKSLYFFNVIYRGIIATWINQASEPVAFGGECIYFYKILPYLNANVKVIELSHLNTWLNYTQAFIPYIDIRVTSTPQMKRDIETQYYNNGVPKQYLSSLCFIDNWVDIPNYSAHINKKLKVLFVGRGAPQKRVHLINRIAEQLIDDGVDFTFVGDVRPLLSEFVQKHAAVHDNISDKQMLYHLYDTSDILILTSAFEGLPIVVMDMMARGKVVLSTAVNGIPDYISHKKTGLLIYETKDEEKIVQDGIKLIKEMDVNRELLAAIGHGAYSFAKDRFKKESFEKQFKSLFNR